MTIFIASGVGAATATQAFAFQKETRGEAGKCSQEKNQYGDINFHRLTSPVRS
jgi:hypothetical protein